MKKLSLTGPIAANRASTVVAPTTTEVLELFFNTGIVYHPVALQGELPDTVSGFVVAKGPDAQAQSISVRRAEAGEDPDVEISILEHIGELSQRWIVVPYQLSCPYAVQLYLAPTGGRRGAVKLMLAIDTLEYAGMQGRFLDAALDEGRPFRPLELQELGSFFDLPPMREYLRRLESSGVSAAPFKLAALYAALAPYLPRIRFTRVESHAPIPVSLVLDFGNSRTTAVLVERRDRGLLSIPLEMRSSSDPFSVTDEAFDSRITFLPSPFEEMGKPLATGEGFTVPSVTRLGREALDRALEAPHRYACTLSSPKRYLWADDPNDERWHFALKQQGEYRPVSGRLLKYIVEEAGGSLLRQDGPSIPADPRYAPRTMMLFAIAEILTQAYSQIAGLAYRKFQGKEGSPRVLSNVVLTFPSAMRDEEKEVYETLVRNAVILVSYLLNVPQGRRPNEDGAGNMAPFLFVDEASAAQMVYLYEEVSNRFAGSMEDFVKVFGNASGKIRIASVDIGGGTTDVMIAEYTDMLAGSGTSLSIRQLFQDGVNIAGDEVCRALVEDVVFPQILHQLDGGATGAKASDASSSARSQLIHLFAEGDAGHGASFRTLKAKLVPYFWLPLARCLWSVAEGFEIRDHTADKLYSVDDIMRIFEGASFSSTVMAEADRFLEPLVPGFPGLKNLFLRFDRDEIERVIRSTLREPLRRYADILAQFDVDLVVLAGRASALPCVRDLVLAEMPVPPPRLKSMSNYRVGDWYPSKWRHNGAIRDPKSTVAAGAAVLHLAANNRLEGFNIEEVVRVQQQPILGLYQDSEPHLGRDAELFRDGDVSAKIVYTSFMRLGFRNVDSPEMDAAPLFEVRPRTPEVERALLTDRAQLTFTRDREGHVQVSEAKSQRGIHTFTKDDFYLKLKTLTVDRYWLDTGVFKNVSRYL